jgi:hypothetical protein
MRDCFMRLCQYLFRLTSAKNKGANRSETPPDDFVNFRYYLEVENEKGGLADHIETVSKLLEGLWAQGIPAVAACDYEESLPESGGCHNGELATHRWQKKY